LLCIPVVVFLENVSLLRYGQPLPFLHVIYRGLGSSVGKAIDHGLDGPGSNPGGDQIFRPSRLAIGPT
jgi:hypothetical protein